MSIHSIRIVDDEDLIRLTLQTNLSDEGFEVDDASSGEKASALLKTRPYDLLLTDYLLGGMNGVELMLQAKEQCPKIKVIIFSGYMSGKTEKEMKQLGADSVLHKPFLSTDLLERIAKMTIS